jgi:hypothetical protein
MTVGGGGGGEAVPKPGDLTRCLLVSDQLAGEHLALKFHKDINQNIAKKHWKRRRNTLKDYEKTDKTIIMHT